MLKKENRYDSYAYRLSDVPASAALLTAGWEEGDFLSLDANGELIKADGTKPAFMSMSSLRKGRDQFTGKTTRQGSILFGCHRVVTNSIDTGVTFAVNDALYVNASGKLTNAKGTAAYIVGYAAGKVDAEGYLKVLVVPPIPAA